MNWLSAMRYNKANKSYARILNFGFPAPGNISAKKVIAIATHQWNRLL